MGQKMKDIRFNAEDVDNSCGIHTIFCTASPVLTNEVRRYYQRLNEKIKLELDKKAERRRLKQEAILKKETEKEGNVLIEKEELKVEEEVKEIKEICTKVVREEGEEFIEIGENQGDIETDLAILDEEEIEKQIHLPHSMSEVQDNHFPLFLTIRRLILMIDGTIRRPFFARKSTG